MKLLTPHAREWAQAPAGSGASGPPYLMGLGLALLWGVGQHLPQQEFYVFGIGPGDFLFLAYCLVGLAVFWDRWAVVKSLTYIRHFALLVWGFVVLGLFSATVNALRVGMLAKDLVETLRPLYYILVTAFTAAWVARHGFGRIVVAFLSGILAVTLANLFHEAPAGIQVLAFRTMYNPNLIGNMLGVGTFLASLLVLDGRFLAATFFTSLFVPLSLFTYSKGGWLMVAIGLAASIIAFFTRSEARRGLRRSSAVWVYAGLVALVAGAVAFGPDIATLVRFKLQTTEFGATAAEGGTIAQRWSFVTASVRMAMDHPLLGVGISNYELEYDRLREFLGAGYHPTDNPHSTFLYLLACMGIPALTVLLAVFVSPFVTLAHLVPFRRLSRVMYVGLGIALFTVSGSTALQLLSQPFWWFFAGVVFGWAHAYVPDQHRSATIP